MVKRKRAKRVKKHRQKYLDLLKQKINIITEKRANMIPKSSWKLFGKLTHPAHNTRVLALSKLCMDTYLEPVFVQMIEKDPSQWVRLQAVKNLGNINSKRAVPKLIARYAFETSVSVGEEILRSLGEIKSKKSEEFLLDFMFKEKAIEKRHVALVSLAKLNSQKAADRLIENLKDPSNPQYQFSLSALSHLARHPTIEIEAAVPYAAKELFSGKKASMSTKFAANIVKAGAHALSGYESRKCLEALFRHISNPEGWDEKFVYKLAEAVAAVARARTIELYAFRNEESERRIDNAIQFFSHESGLDHAKANLLTYAVVSQPKLFKKVPLDMEKAKREDLEYLKNLRRQARERTEAEIILALGIGKK